MMAVILEEKERYADGSVWMCSGCNATFNSGGRPKRCEKCKEPVGKLLKLPADRKPAPDNKATARAKLKKQ
jgi:hypothetical protein